jgi:hypothetical protein
VSAITTATHTGKPVNGSVPEPIVAKAPRTPPAGVPFPFPRLVAMAPRTPPLGFVELVPAEVPVAGAVELLEPVLCDVGVVLAEDFSLDAAHFFLFAWLFRAWTSTPCGWPHTTTLCGWLLPGP